MSLAKRVRREVLTSSLAGSIVAITALGVMASAAGCSGVVGSPGTEVTRPGAGGGGSSSTGSPPTAGSQAGSATAGSTGTGGSGGGNTAACAPASARRVRRLAQREYLNVVTDLLGADPAAIAAPMMPLEPTVAGFDNQDDALLASASFQEALANIAEKLSAGVNVSKLAPCATAAGSPSCLQTFAQSFPQKAFGRAPTTSEVQRLLAVAATGTSYATSVQLIVEVVLQSPQMVYVSELGPDAPPQGRQTTITPHEVASQVSLLLTGSRPDDELLRAANEGRLATADELTTQVTRLLATPRAKLQLRLLIEGWLDIGKVADSPKDPEVFPAFTGPVVAAMQAELDGFIDDNVAAGEGTFASLLSQTSARIPSALVPIYGSDLLSGQSTPKLDPKKRQGILALPGVLAYHAADQHSGPIDRGLTVRRQLLCQEVPPPPPAVLERIAQNPIDTTNKATTTRMKYQQHKDEAFCAACHSQFDAIGFGMEEMDGIGRHRTTENGLPIDTTGELNGTDVDGPFSGVTELSKKLAESQMFATCFVRQFFRFAAARVPEDSEQCIVDAWAKSLADGGGHFKDLIVRHVSDPNFATRKEDR